MSRSFRCPECGAPIEASGDDARLELDCPECGKPVLVPSRRRDDRPSIELTPEESTSAARGVTLLQISLLLYVLSVVAGSAFFGVRVAVDGFEAAVNNEGQTVWVGIVWGVVGLVIMTAAAVLRTVGYRRCQPVGVAIDSDTVLTLAAIGAVIAGVGGALAGIPGLTGQKPDQLHPALMGLMYLGGMVGLVGMGLEFTALLFFHRLLKELGGRTAAGRVVTYVVSLGGAAAVMFVGACGLGMFIGITAAAQGRGGGRPPGPMKPGDLPEETWVAVGVYAAVLFAAGGLVCWLYYRVLSRAKAGLVAAAAGPESEP